VSTGCGRRSRGFLSPTDIIVGFPGEPRKISRRR
jgi:hypothetical protein